MDKEHQEYYVANESSPQALCKIVSSHLRNGWQLVGGLQVAAWADPSGETLVIHYQALVYRERVATKP